MFDILGHLVNLFILDRADKKCWETKKCSILFTHIRSCKYILVRLDMDYGWGTKIVVVNRVTFKPHLLNAHNFFRLIS
jgi:hypothetical protein